MKIRLKHMIQHWKEPATILTVLLLAFLFTLSSGAQSGEYDIRWIGQFPGKEGEKTQSLGDKISRVVFGKRPQVVVKPFNMVADNPGHYWILDQGAGSLFEVEDGKGRPDRSMKKAGQDFPSLVGICKGPGDGLFFTDSRLNQVMQVSGDKLSLFADSLTLNQPTGIAFNGRTGEIWVVETGAHRVSLFNSEGEWLKSVGERGTDPGLFNFPTFICMRPLTSDTGGTIAVGSFN